jgi:glycosyltransferase involved in cell wall biosynthesis
MSPVRRAALSLVSGLAAKCADIVTTVSRFSRDELVRWYKLPGEKIQVISSGPGARHVEQMPLTTPELERSVGAGPYITAMGGSWAHKNISRLVQAYEQIACDIPHRLIISGSIYGATVETKLCDKILCTGYLERSDLQELLRRSDLFVMPSLYEGFGFPVLEAQSLGVAVACSNVAALPELMRDSAAFFDPENVNEMAEVTKRCVTDRSFNEEMRRKSGENIRRFSWTSTAAGYEELYIKLGQKKSGWLPHSFACILRVLRAS